MANRFSRNKNERKNSANRKLVSTASVDNETIPETKFTKKEWYISLNEYMLSR